MKRYLLMMSALALFGACQATEQMNEVPNQNDQVQQPSVQPENNVPMMDLVPAVPNVPEVESEPSNPLHQPGVHIVENNPQYQHNLDADMPF